MMPARLDYLAIYARFGCFGGEKCGTAGGRTRIRAAASFGFVRPECSACYPGRELAACGTVSAYNRGCRCSECRAAVAVKNKLLLRRRGVPERPPTVPCPSAQAYRRGCRCAGCRSASAEYSREYRRRVRDGKQTRRKQPRRHGTAAVYDLGCRCRYCEAAAEERRRRRRTRMGQVPLAVYRRQQAAKKAATRKRAA